MLNVKNKAVGNWYVIMASLFNPSQNTSLNAATNYNSITCTSNFTTGANNIVFNENGSYIMQLVFRAGTDTTTATTATMGDVVTPTSNGNFSNSTLYPSVAANASSSQWSGIWNANAFGGGPTIVLGEFGLSAYLQDNVKGYLSMIRRVCVADGNFSPLTVTTSLPLTVSVLVANE